MARLISRMLSRTIVAPDIVSGLQFIEESEEDEWSALHYRLEQEGLNSLLPLEEKLLHVWRWLGDAENNLRTSRKMLDKQRKQQNQELKEVELFVSKLKEITDERVQKVELEKQNLELEMEDLKSQNSEINLNEIVGMLRQEGLHNIVYCSLSEQVAYLLVERARLMEEIELEKERHKGLTANLTDNVKLSSPQMHEILEQLKVDYEKQLHVQRENAIRVSEQMRKSLEEELRKTRQELRDSKKTVESLTNQNISFNQGPQELQNKIFELSERIRKMEKAMRQLENENETLIYKLSEALTECDEKETLIRNMKVNAVATSRRNSIITSPREASPRINEEEREQEKISSEETKKLLSDVEKLQDELAKWGEKYDTLATKYERRKHHHRKRIEKQKELHQKEINILKDKTKCLQQEVTMTRMTLQAERAHSDKILNKLVKLTEENKQLSARLLEVEETINEKTRNLSLLNLRVSHLEKEKVQLEKNINQRLSANSTTNTNKIQTDLSEMFKKLRKTKPTTQMSLDEQIMASTSNSPINQENIPLQTKSSPIKNTTARPNLLRFFSQPESFSPAEQQQQQQQQQQSSFGSRLETLLSNIDQLRTIVVASAGNLTPKKSVN